MKAATKQWNPPSTWDPMGTDEFIKVVNLSSSSSEYQRIESLFNAPGTGHSIVQVRVLNMWILFCELIMNRFFCLLHISFFLFLARKFRTNLELVQFLNCLAHSRNSCFVHQSRNCSGQGLNYAQCMCTAFDQI